MIMRNNRNEVIGELNTSFTKDGSTIITNTLYYGKCVVTQQVSLRDSQGKVKNMEVFGGKILP